MSFVSVATENDSAEAQSSSSNEVNAAASCNSWWLGCILDKIVSEGDYSIMGPGVSGDP